MSDEVAGGLDEPEGPLRGHAGVPGLERLRDGVAGVEGIVAVWGRVESHRDGLRAQHARVCALGRRPGAEAIAGCLGVDLLETGELEAAAGAYGAPLPASLVP